ncbi:MAG: YceH family protein [Planctomycetota bacterium]|jgi:uncharacterized protein YceH (UPF0502 family)
MAPIENENGALDSTAPAESAAADAPPVQLDDVEARVIGVLIEKALTTPAQYPLSLNALVNGCNQRSNRNPVLDLDEPEVLNAIQRLRRMGMASTVQRAGSRVDRYRHTARECLNLEGYGLSILAELMMRGPQMPGELRARASRMVPIRTVGELESLLEQLIDRELVKRIRPARGSRAPRYVQLLSPDLHDLGDEAELDDTPSARPARSAGSRSSRSGGGDPALAATVARLETQLAWALAAIARLADAQGVALPPRPSTNEEE